MINTEISPPNNNNNNTTVYVSNLADALSEDHLLQFLSCLGTIVEMKLFVPPPTPTSSSLLGNNKQRIYQVTFSQETEAKSAIDVSDTVLLGHSILISHSIPSLLPPPPPPPLSSSSIIASPQQQQQQQTTLSPPPPFHHHPLQQQQQQSFVQPLLQQHFHQPHQLSSPNSGSSSSSASLTSFYPPAPSHASTTTFVSNPYIRPVRNMPFAPIASTGNDEKDREIARTIYVGNINSKVSPAELVDFFSVCGPVAYIRMAGDESQPTRFAFIEFLDMDAAQMAMTMNGRMLMDRPIKINRSKNTIVKPPVKLTREEQKQLDYAVDKLSRKLQQCRQQEEAVN